LWGVISPEECTIIALQGGEFQEEALIPGTHRASTDTIPEKMIRTCFYR